MGRINALERIEKMSKEEIAEKLKAALEESGIEYTEQSVAIAQECIWIDIQKGEINYASKNWI